MDKIKEIRGEINNSLSRVSLSDLDRYGFLNKVDYQRDLVLFNHICSNDIKKLDEEIHKLLQD